MYKNFFDPEKYSESELKIIEKLLLFDAAGYLAANPDLAEAEVDPLRHFMCNGMYESRAPWSIEALARNRDADPKNLFGEKMTLLDLIGFDEAFYRATYPEVPADYFTHFLNHGMRERRRPFDFLDHLASEKVTWTILKKYGLDEFGSLDRQMRIRIDDPNGYIGALLDAALRNKIKPKAYRNNFWMALAIGFTALNYFGAASICYSYFYNFFLVMPQLGNWKENMHVTGHVHLTTDFARSKNWTVIPLATEANITIPDPEFLNRPNLVAEESVHPMPRSHYCVLEDVIVFGLNGMILSGSHDLLYDYLDLDNTDRPAEIKGPNVLHLINQNCTYTYIHTEKSVPEAFSLLHDHSHNYFHWLIEVLPRYLLARKNGLAKNIPLLIDEKLSPLLANLLETVVGDPALLIRVPRGHSVSVAKLHWVSDLSSNTVHTDEAPLKSDILLSPTAFELLRELAAHCVGRPVKAFERLLITRSNVSFRRLINRHLFRDMLGGQGFWSFDPGQVPFEEQVRVFSNARIVVGEAGAALANIAFCQPGTIVVVLVNGFKNSNYYYLAEMARSCQLRLVFFECLRLEGSHPLGVHDDMVVNIHEFEQHLAKLTAPPSEEVVPVKAKVQKLRNRKTG